MKSSLNASPHLRRFKNQFILPENCAWSPAWIQAHICGGLKINLFCPNMVHEVQPECKPTSAEVSKSIYFARIWCMESSRNASPHLRRFQNWFILPEYDAWSPAGMQTHIWGGCENTFILAEYNAGSSVWLQVNIWPSMVHWAGPDFFLLVGGWSREIAMPEFLRHGKFPLSDFCIFFFLAPRVMRTPSSLTIYLRPGFQTGWYYRKFFIKKISYFCVRGWCISHRQHNFASGV